MEKFVYHYTSLDALRSIIQEDAVHMWATHYNYLNDPSEQIWAEENIIDAVNRLDDYRNVAKEEIKSWLGKDTYIVSLCKKRDYRNMWRLYCQDGKGACLVFDKNMLRMFSERCFINNPQDTFDIFEEVKYSSASNIDKNVRSFIKKKTFNIAEEEDASKFMRIASFIKNDDFRIEEEVRYARIREVKEIKIPYDHETGGIGKPSITKNEKDVKYRMRGNDYVKYLEIGFPCEALKEIILGYEVNEENARIFIESIIGSCNGKYKEVKISSSSLFSSKNK